MSGTTFTALFPFGGSGGGALGFLDAEVRLLGSVGAFECLGSIDFDAEACVDFERFTGAPAWCVDVQQVMAAELIERYGAKAPHVVFMSPPCKGSSRLLSSEKAATPKYQAMNQLAVVWTRAMLAAWGDDPPALVLLENVPGLPTRAAGMLRELRELLKAAGYVFHASTHDCGEIGGLAQHRERYLLVARHPKKCPSLLYQPPKRRVRGVGEVLTKLPMPATMAASSWGALHTMPKLSWRNWLRLALIPAGGDWRDLDGVLKGRERREVFRRHAVQAWEQPHPAVTGPGGHSVESVADPRVAIGGKHLHNNKHNVVAWDDAAPTVIGKAQPSAGAAAVADPRVLEIGAAAVGDTLPDQSRGEFWNNGAYGVRGWDDASGTVTGKGHPGNGTFAVADPRVTPLCECGHFHVVDRGAEDCLECASCKRFVPADAPLVEALRVPVAYDAGYGVLRMDQPARTVAGETSPGCGAYAVADHRDRHGFVPEVRLLTLDEAMALDLDPKKAPPFVPVIVAEDGTWHRPMTALELAALQSYPLVANGKRLSFEGGRTLVLEHIGNSVPPDAARGVAEQMLVALMEAELGAFSLQGGDTPVWVTPEMGMVAT